MAQVRYIVNDVEDAVAFYVSKLGFELEQQYGTAFAIVVHGDLTLWLAGPKASASKPIARWRYTQPGRLVQVRLDSRRFRIPRLKAQGRWCNIQKRYCRGAGGQTDSLQRSFW